MSVRSSGLSDAHAQDLVKIKYLRIVAYYKDHSIYHENDVICVVLRKICRKMSSRVLWFLTSFAYCLVKGFVNRESGINIFTFLV